MKPCDLCGAPGAAPLADQHICDDCYIARGSCCAGEFEEESTCSSVELMMDAPPPPRSCSPE